MNQKKINFLNYIKKTFPYTRSEKLWNIDKQKRGPRPT